MKREEKREHTKKLLLDTTKALIQEKGCSQLTIADIMARSGLSKGAIFHYIRKKDELFTMVLQERLDDIHARFTAAAQKENADLEGPLGEIVSSYSSLQDPDDVTNQIFIYLLGKSDMPEAAELTQSFYDESVRLAKAWILAGQNKGVIPSSVDADKTADLFVLISLGIRVRSTVSDRSFAFTNQDFAKLTKSMLKGQINE
ncbi:TetR/AcrR family transcriptional regulator [Marinicrinis lubricantis]|uniref:TetR/AcrR family transcriptional regulator n=1 Tax=Marinicrinis lubricantis TaxID=2086470 RepID=A0ABW1IVF8_9BACL